jgi:hypothetical protein
MIQHNGANGADSSPAVVPFHFNDFAVSWAGPGIGEDEFCFGSEDGQLRFTTVDGAPTRQFVRGEKDPESVNGVAFAGSVIAISDRREIFFRVPGSGPTEAERLVFPYGAHGVIATGDGDFVAPLGGAGLLRVSTDKAGQRRFIVSQIPQQTMNYYKVVNLHSDGQPDVIACAVRKGGIAATELVPDGEKTRIRSLTFPGLDVVDVCALGTGASPPAIAALDRAGSLILLKNALNDASPICMNFPGVNGTAYRVFCAQGNILMLTSTGLHVLPSLARRFLDGESVGSTPTAVQAFPLEAVDANLCGRRWLLVVLTHGVLRFDLDNFAAGLPAGESDRAEPTNSPVLISPAWEFRQELMTVST